MQKNEKSRLVRSKKPLVLAALGIFLFGDLIGVSQVFAENNEVSQTEQVSPKVTEPINISDFADLEEAVANFTTATEDVVINITADIEMNEGLLISNDYGKTMTIQSTDGNSLLHLESTQYSLLTATTNLNLNNIVLDGQNIPADAALLSATTNGNVILGSGTILQNNEVSSESDGGAITLGGGRVTMETGSQLINNRAITGGAVLVQFDSVFTLNGGEIINNHAANIGGGIYAEEGNVTINSGTIKDNAATANGGGIYNSASAIFDIRGGEINTNTASGMGGGIYSEGQLNINNAKFLNNRGLNGSAVHAISLSSNGNVFYNTGASTSDLLEVAGLPWTPETDENANDVAIAWNGNNSVYDAGSNTDLDLLFAGPQPTTATAVWAIQDGTPGIAYKNGDNVGFIPVDITVNQTLLPFPTDRLSYDLPQGAIYNGLAQGITTPVIADYNETDFGVITVTYAPAGSDEFTDEVPTNAGEYQVKVAIAGGAVYDAYSEIKDFSIAKKAITVTADNFTIKKGETLPKLTVNYDGFVSPDDENTIFDRLPEVSTNADGLSDGTFAITVTPGQLNTDAGANYDDTDAYINGSLKVTTANNPSPNPDPTPDPNPTPDPEPTPDPDPVEEDRLPLYRVYNPNNGEHLYTLSETEAQGLIEQGWQDEGIGWHAGETEGKAAYRLYNPNSGEHFYTLDVNEYDSVANAGWKKEGIAFYAAEDTEIPVYRVFNPNAQAAGSHHYTLSATENSWLIQQGWRAEGTAFYGK